MIKWNEFPHISSGKLYTMGWNYFNDIFMRHWIMYYITMIWKKISRKHRGMKVWKLPKNWLHLIVLVDDLYDCFNGRALTANIFESGSMPTPWKFLAGSPAIPSCWLGES